MVWALTAALVGMVGYGLGTALQAGAAGRADGLAVLRHPLYLAGVGCDAIAWLASLVALQRLPLFAVQALLAGSLAVTVLLARVFLKTTLRARDAVAIAVVIPALSAVAAASDLQATHPPLGALLLPVVGSLVALGLLTLVLYRRGRAMPMAVVCGLAFSGSALCARAIPVDDRWHRLLAAPLVWLVAAFGLIGALALSRALERSAAGPVTAVMWVVEVVVPGAVGVLALGDKVRPGWAGGTLVAVLVALACCAVLATSPAQSQPHVSAGTAAGSRTTSG